MQSRAFEVLFGHIILKGHYPLGLGLNLYSIEFSWTSIKSTFWIL